MVGGEQLTVETISMSNKAWDKINELDRLIQRTLKLGMDSGTFLKIEYIYGFEKFNTRPYHNYETWAGGYRVTDTRNNVVVEREDLDDALLTWKKQVECKHDFSPLVPDGVAAWKCKSCMKLNPEKRVAAKAD